MRPNARRLRELIGDQDHRQIAVEAQLDSRTLSALLSGTVTDRFQYNTINSLARYFGVPFAELIEPIPDNVAGVLRQRKAKG